MKIEMSLSTESINSAIKTLQMLEENLDIGVDQALDVLATEGGFEAQSAYGGMATAYGVAGDKEGRIVSTGENNLIAEFGAGNATIDPSALFENVPYTDVFPGSYSLEEGSKEYWNTLMSTGNGRWHFGGREYTEVQPRMGLYKAKMFVIEHSTEIMTEVLGL